MWELTWNKCLGRSAPPLSCPIVRNRGAEKLSKQHCKKNRLEKKPKSWRKKHRLEKNTEWKRKTTDLKNKKTQNGEKTGELQSWASNIATNTDWTKELPLLLFSCTNNLYLHLWGTEWFIPIQGAEKLSNIACNERRLAKTGTFFFFRLRQWADSENWINLLEINRTPSHV